MRAFVAGASGYTGQHLCRELIRRGAEVTAHIRPGSPRLQELAKPFAEQGVEIDRSAWTEQSIKDSLARCRPTVVFALLGTTRKRAKQEGVVGNIYQQVEGELTSLLIRATQQAAPDALFVFLSSFGVNSKTTNPYLKTRHLLEQQLESSRLHFSIARPAMITGSDRPEHRPGESVGASVIDTGLSLLGVIGARKLQAKYQSISGEHLAIALARIAETPTYHDRVVHSGELQELSRALREGD